MGLWFFSKLMKRTLYMVLLIKNLWSMNINEFARLWGGKIWIIFLLSYKIIYQLIGNDRRKDSLLYLTFQIIEMKIDCWFIHISKNFFWNFLHSLLGILVREHRIIINRTSIRSRSNETIVHNSILYNLQKYHIKRSISIGEIIFSISSITQEYLYNELELMNLSSYLS
jgi:hypothetical protein